MQPPPPAIDLRQDRDFGEVFNATFAFIKQHLGILAKSVLFFAAPVAAVAALFFGRYMTGLMGMLTRLEEDPAALLSLLPSVLLGAAFYVLSYVLLQVVVLGVMKLHETRGPGRFTVSDVWQQGKRYILPVLGFGVLFGFAAMASAILNLIPCLGTIVWFVGLLYVGTRLSLTAPAYVLDDRGFSDGFKTSWEITRPAFWQTFGVLIVTTLIAGVLASIFQLPLQVFVQAQALFSGDPEAILGVFSSPWMVLYMVVVTIAQQLLYVIPVVAIGLQYGNLSETITQSGLMDRLSTFAEGTQEPGEGTV